ncbi:hypothetical protein ACLOJK_010131 [Asimina triloba]
MTKTSFGTDSRRWRSQEERGFNKSHPDVVYGFRTERGSIPFPAIGRRHIYLGMASGPPDALPQGRDKHVTTGAARSVAHLSLGGGHGHSLSRTTLSEGQEAKKKRDFYRSTCTRTARPLPPMSHHARGIGHVISGPHVISERISTRWTIMISPCVSLLLYH